MEIFFEKILELPLKYIQLKSTGEIIKRIEDIDEISTYYIEIIITTLLNLSIIVPISIILIIKIPQIMYIIIIYIITNLFISKYATKYLKLSIQNLVDSSETYNSYLTNYIEGLSSIYHNDNKNYFFIVMIYT